MTENGRKDIVQRDEAALESTSSDAEIASFVRQARALAPARGGNERGRMIFALDATMSRQPTWDTACQLQAEMFNETVNVGGLDVQLVYFRGFGECRASKWASDARQLADMMGRIDCRGGHTQIRKVLAHARKEAEKKRVHALVYVGDCVEEAIDMLAQRAGELALHNVPCFMFQEGRQASAEMAFKEIARLTRGAWCPFDAGAANQLRELLSAVAVYAAGGRLALEDYGKRHGGGRLLLQKLGG